MKQIKKNHLLKLRHYHQTHQDQNQNQKNHKNHFHHIQNSSNTSNTSKIQNKQTGVKNTTIIPTNDNNNKQNTNNNKKLQNNQTLASANNSKILTNTQTNHSNNTDNIKNKNISDSKPIATSNNQFLSTKPNLITDFQSPSQQSSTPKGLIVIIIFSIIAIIIIIYVIYSCIKKSRALKKYNQTPQNFTQKPKLTAKQLQVLNQKKLIMLTDPQTLKNTKKSHITTIQQKNQYGNRFYQVKFKNPKSSTLMYENQLITDCYFQIEMIEINSQIQFGFIHHDQLQTIQKIKTEGNQDLGRLGISINNYGIVQLHGENLHNFKWNLSYGDIIGIGITVLSDIKRVWITKNGQLLNPPTLQQRQQWIASQQITAQMKQNFKKQKSSTQAASKLGYERASKQQENKKKKIVLHSSKQFRYYAVITSSVLRKENPSIINVNVGGNVFRMRQQSLSMGLLGKSRHYLGFFPCC